MEQKEFAAKTVELATEQGLKDLGLTMETADIVILEDKGGLFKKARVLISKKKSEGELAVFFIEQLLEKMQIKAVATLKESEEECLIEITSQETGSVVGKRGEVLDSIQYLASMYVNRDKDDFRRIVVDCENYREKRIENLKAIANRMAEKAEELGKRVFLDPMNPYERRIVHAELQKNERVKTESRGEEPNRCVVIYPKNRKFDANERGGFNRDRKPGGSGGFNRDRKPGEGGGFNRDKKFDTNRSGGFNRDNRDSRGGGARPEKSKEISFGTFLGNVNDQKNKTEE